MNGFTYGHILALITMVLLVPAAVAAQTRGASATMKGTVSEVVNLSIAPNTKPGDVAMEFVSSGSSVRIRLSGSGDKSSVVRLPLLVRSNTGFRIMGTADSETALLTQVLVTDVRATGKLVSPEAVDNSQRSQLNLQGLGDDPLLVWSGPRVSLGGTLTSSDNALQITLLIHIKPRSVATWVAHLTLSNN